MVPPVDGNNPAPPDPYGKTKFRGMGVPEPYHVILFRDTHVGGARGCAPPGGMAFPRGGTPPVRCAGSLVGCVNTVRLTWGLGWGRVRCPEPAKPRNEIRTGSGVLRGCSRSAAGNRSNNNPTRVYK